MKVAIACPYDWSQPGGVRSHIIGLAGALQRRDIQVEVFAPVGSYESGATNGRTETKSASAGRVAVQGNLKVFAAGKSVGIPFNGSVARICFSPGAKRRIAERLSIGRFDVLHVHEPAAPSVSLLALISARIPAVATFHAASVAAFAYGMARPVLRPIFEKLSGRIAVSDASRALVARHFPGDYRVIPNGIDLNTLAGASSAQELLPLKPFVVFVGRPEPRKGLRVLMEAMNIVRETLPASLVLVGPNPSEVPAVGRAANQPGGDGSWLRALGPVSSEELPSILKTADVFCAPSLGGESFGIVLAEAMGAGVPVVCSDIAGYKQAAAGAALHARAGDAPATAHAILELLTDSSKAAELIERGNARAAELDWELLVDQLIDSYSKAIYDR